jgi:hypothetical protein
VFERFTDRARRVVVLAQEEARMLEHHYIGTEHLLLGLINEGEGVAAQVLESLDISLDQTRAQIEEIVGRGDGVAAGHIPFTPRAKKVLELSLREALQLGHSYIGTEHLLLGMIREGEGVAAQALVHNGATLNQVRQRVIEVLSGYEPGEESRAAGLEAAAGGGPGGFVPGGAIHPGGPSFRWRSRVRTRPSRPTPADWPSCPGCASDLRESAAYRTIPVEECDGGSQHGVLFVFCRACGTTLGAIDGSGDPA